MQMLYDSDNFVVVHVVVNQEPGAEMPLVRRDGFEIVNKMTNLEVFLVDSWAKAFSDQINAWQAKTPSQEEVEKVLDQYTFLLAQYPLVIH